MLCAVLGINGMHTASDVSLLVRQLVTLGVLLAFAARLGTRPLFVVLCLSFCALCVVHWS